MRNFTIYLALILCLFFSKAIGQETFEKRAKAIAQKIERITEEEKEFLKMEVEDVNIQLEKGMLTKEQAEQKKVQLAQSRAASIENKIALVHEELKGLVQERLDGKIKERVFDASYSLSFPSMKVKDLKKDTIQGEARSTSQFVFAAGLNNLVTNNTVAYSDYRGWGSHFYEWGLTYNTRILKNDNLLHAKYGFSVMYNNLRPTENRIFVTDGNQTNLVQSPIHLKDSRFRNVYLTIPLHLEFDFSGNTPKNDKPYFKIHQGFRLGIGGFAGINLKSKQILNYEVDGNLVRERTRGDFNGNDFVYGLSTYIGYKETSLYLKYDLNPLFQNNIRKQNNISLGIRFDFN